MVQPATCASPFSLCLGRQRGERSAVELVDSIDGDHNNVIGISLPLLRLLIADLGVTIPDLWSQYSSVE